MKQYIIVLIALSGLSFIQTTHSMLGPPPGVVAFINQTPDPVFLQINGDQVTYYGLKPGENTLNKGYTGVITKVAVFTTGQRTMYWDLNKWRSKIEAEKAAFFHKFPTFPRPPSSVGHMTVTPTGLKFLISQTDNIGGGHWFDELFSYNCSTQGNHWMTWQCPPPTSVPR